MKNPFKGTGTALVTPFKADYSIDFEALRKLVNQQIDGKVDFLVVQGTTGESPVLTWTEKLQILDTVIDENKGRKPVVFGCGGNNTADVVDKLKQIPAGVDGILSVSPYYNKPTQAGIVAHFKEVAKATKLPIILYNVPGRTGSNMTVETTLELAKVDNLVAVKEASGDMEQIMTLIHNRPDGFGVLSGDDPITMPLMSCGADGVISVVSNALPLRFSEMVRNVNSDKHNEAVESHLEMLQITKLFFSEGNPGGVKESLQHQGIMENYMRMPLMNVSEQLAEKICLETDRLLNL